MFDSWVIKVFKTRRVFVLLLIELNSLNFLLRFEVNSTKLNCNFTFLNKNVLMIKFFVLTTFHTSFLVSIFHTRCFNIIKHKIIFYYHAQFVCTLHFQFERLWIWVAKKNFLKGIGNPRKELKNRSSPFPLFLLGVWEKNRTY